MLSIRPLAQPDQTLDSIAAWVWLQNGLRTWPDALEAVFGSRSIKADRPFFNGVSHAFEAVDGAGHSSLDAWIDRQSFLALFTPFTDPERLRTAKEKLVSNRLAGLPMTLGCDSLPLLRNDRRYCPACVQEEIRRLGFGYSHRTHQVRGVDFCPVHGIALELPPQGEAGIAAPRGLITAPWTAGDGDGSEWASPQDREPDQNLARWVGAVFAGDVPTVGRWQRLGAIEARIDKMPRIRGEPSSQARRLENLLVRVHGSNRLAEMGLPVTEGVTSHWPALLLAGHAFCDHPTANLLVLSALFEGPAEYAGAVAQVCEPPTEPKPVRMPPPRSLRRVWSLALIKELLREPSLAVVAEKHGFCLQTLRDHLAAYPDLHDRRPAALGRARRRRARHTIRAFVRDTPQATRRMLCRQHKSAYNNALRHDREWLEEILPARKSACFLANAPQAVLQDARLAREITALAQAARDGDEPIWVTKAWLTERLHPAKPRDLRSGCLPLTRTAIDELAEKAAEFHARVLARLDMCVRGGEAERAFRIAARFLKMAGRQSHLIDRVLAILEAGIAQASSVPVRGGAAQ